MKSKFTPLLTLFSAALIGGIGLSLTSDSGQAASDATTADPVAGRYCIASGPAIQLLGAKPQENGDLQFGLSVWFDSGQHCGVIGTAKQNPAGGWRYEENMTSENEEERCGIDIKPVEGGVFINADEKAACSFACGGGAAISNLAFPPQSQESKRAASGLFDPETLYNTTCTPKP